MRLSSSSQPVLPILRQYLFLDRNSDFPYPIFFRGIQARRRGGAGAQHPGLVRTKTKVFLVEDKKKRPNGQTTKQKNKQTTENAQKWSIFQNFFAYNNIIGIVIGI